MFQGQGNTGQPQGQHSILDTYGMLMNEYTDSYEELVGREREVDQIIATLYQRKKPNPVLIGEAGVGKTQIIEGVVRKINNGEVTGKLEDAYIYQMDVKMLSGALQKFGQSLVNMMIQEVNENLKDGHLTILFFDEMHLLVGALSQANPNAENPADVLKPALARGDLRVIGATTVREYRNIETDKALERRFSPIYIDELSHEETLQVLEGARESYEEFHGVTYGEDVFETSIELASRYMADRVFPDKALDVIDKLGATMSSTYDQEGLSFEEERLDYEGTLALLNMSRNLVNNNVSQANHWGREFEQVVESQEELAQQEDSDRKLITKLDVRNYIKDSQGLDTLIEEYTEEDIIEEFSNRIIGQDDAVNAVANHMILSNYGFKNSDKPKSTMLFYGATGVGKALSDEEMIPVYTEKGETLYKRNGDMKEGDFVFNQEGKPTKVTGVFPQGNKRAYKVILTDGREIICNDEHLWTWQSKKQRSTGSKNWNTTTLRELIDRGLTRNYKNGRKEVKYWIPMNEGVDRPKIDYGDGVDPYVLGAMIGNGNLTDETFTISSSTEDVVNEVSKLIGAKGYDRAHQENYNWIFSNGEKFGSMTKRVKTREIFNNIPNIMGLKSGDMYIPEIYKMGSMEQRWSLIKGLFDTDGSIEDDGYRHGLTYSTTSKRLSEDLVEVLYSLGVSTTTGVSVRDGKSDEYIIRVKSTNKDKYRFFRAKKSKIEVAERAKKVNKKREKEYTHVGIKEVIDMGKDIPMTCIMVEDEKHLYQASKHHIVTHNTEMAKQISRVMFGSEELLAIDGAEYQDKYTVSKLVGSPAGYVGYGSPTPFDSLRRKPNQVVLIDEFDKMHMNVKQLFLGILEEGRLMDGSGNNIPFHETVIIFTTNEKPSEYQGETTVGFSQVTTVEQMLAMENDLFDDRPKFDGMSPELVNRFDEVIKFNDMTQEMVEHIFDIKFKDFQQFAFDEHGWTVNITDNARKNMVEASFNPDFGARPINRNISRLESMVVKEYSQYRAINDGEEKTEFNIAVREEKVVVL